MSLWQGIQVQKVPVNPHLKGFLVGFVLTRMTCILWSAMKWILYELTFKNIPQSWPEPLVKSAFLWLAWASSSSSSSQGQRSWGAGLNWGCPLSPSLSTLSLNAAPVWCRGGHSPTSAQTSPCNSECLRLTALLMFPFTPTQPCPARALHFLPHTLSNSLLFPSQLNKQYQHPPSFPAKSLSFPWFLLFSWLHL